VIFGDTSPDGFEDDSKEAAADINTTSSCIALYRVRVCSAASTVPYLFLEDVAPDDILDVSIATSAATQNLYAEPLGAGSATATSDPFLYIDPAFADASLFSIIVSDGVGNAPISPGSGPSSIPEPGSLALLVTALGIWLAWDRRVRLFRRQA
jgi:hypothetical protein